MRGVAVGLLLVCALFLVGASFDDCTEGSASCLWFCHLLCRDGCTNAPLPVVQAQVTAADPAPRLASLPRASLRLLSRPTDPEIAPPRA